MLMHPNYVSSDFFADGFLEYLPSGSRTKIESLVPVETYMCRKSGDVEAIPLQFQMMVPLAGSACKSTFTPFIFPIPRNRSAYSFNRLLVIVSSLWTVFATLTRPRSSAVWKPIKGSVFVCPFIT